MHPGWGGWRKAKWYLKVNRQWLKRVFTNIEYKNERVNLY